MEPDKSSPSPTPSKQTSNASIVEAPGKLDTSPKPITSNGPVVDTPFNGAMQPADTTLDPKAPIDLGGVLEQVPLDQPQDSPTALTEPTVSRKRLVGLGLLLVGIIAATTLGIRIEGAKSKALNANLAGAAARVVPQSTSLQSLNQQLGSNSPAASLSTLTVNGQLSVSDSLVLQPSVLSGPAIAGQLYYDRTSNELAYYNGSHFVTLQGGSSVTNNTITNNYYTTNTAAAASTGTTTSSGTPDTLAMFASDGKTLANSPLTAAGGGIADSGAFSVAGSAVFQDTAGSTAAFAVKNTIGQSIINVNTDTGSPLVDDNLTTSAPSGTLTSAATWVSGQYVQLTNGNQYTYGNVEYAPAVGGSFDASFDVWANTGGADETYFYAYTNSPPDNPSGNGIQYNSYGGYLVSYSSTYNDVELIFDGVKIASAPLGNISSGAWHTGEVVKNGSTFTVYFDGSVVLTYTDSPRSLAGTLFGVGASSGYFTGTWRVRNFKLYAGSPIGALTIGAPTQLNGNISISGQATAISVGTESESVSATTNSTRTFQVQDAGGKSLFTVDTTNKALVLGNDSTPTALTIRGGVTSGTNAAGADLTFQGSNGTGSANGGNILFQTGHSAEGGIQFDAAATDPGNLGSNSMSLTVTAQADRILLVSSNCVNSGITYDGEALTRSGYIEGPHSLASNNGDYAELWYLVNPPSGTHLITTMTTSCEQYGGMNFAAASYYGVNQTDPLGTAITASGSQLGNGDTTLIIPTTTTSQVVADMLSTDFQYGNPLPYTCTPAVSGQTIRWATNTTYNASDCGSDIAGSGGPVTISYQTPQADWADIAVVLNPAVPGSTPLQSVSGSSPDAMQTRLAIDANGNVGIDNSNPQYSLDVTGSERIQSPNGSLNELQVQNSNNDTLFNVDTINSQVDIGTIASTGYTSVGTTQDNSENGAIEAEQIESTAHGGTMTSISFYMGNAVEAAPLNEYQVGVYTDNNGVPGNWVASSTVGTLTPNAWNTATVSATLSPNTRYWLVYTTNTDNSSDNALSYNYPTTTPLNGLAMYGTPFTFGSGSKNGMPATWPAGGNTQTGGYWSFYGTITGGGPALTIGSTGAITTPVLLQNSTDSTSAFMVDNAIGSILLNADTQNMSISVNGSLYVSGTVQVGGNFSAGGNVTFYGHLITTGSAAPAIAAGAAACTAPTVSISGTDTAGTVTVTTGSGCTGGGILAHITFASSFGNPPNIALTPESSTAQTLGEYVDGSTLSDTGFSLDTNSTPTAATTYKWSYLTIQ